MRGHVKRRFKPKNPEKYVGDKTNIVARSSWESIVFHWLDKNPSVIKWASEEIVVPYTSPVDGEQHRYFTDVWVKFKDKNGETQEKILEIKPYGQTVMPTNRHAKNYRQMVETYLVNQAKWEAATKYAEARKMKFQVLTEYDLGLARRS